MIWCVEDDGSIRDIEIYALRSMGFEAEGFEDGASFWTALQKNTPELVVLDVMLRRYKPAEKNAVLKSGGIEMNLGEHTVTVSGENIALTYKEFELLRLLMTNPGIVFTRDQLMEKVWGMEYYGETRTVDMHIRTLRQKLGQCGEMIRTVRGVGYRLEARA